MILTPQRRVWNGPQMPSLPAAWALATLAASTPAFTQQALVPPPPPVETTTPLGPAPLPEAGQTVSSFLPQVVRAIEPSQWPPISLRPHLSYTFAYGNGIQSSPGVKQNTIWQDLSPGLALDVGKAWRLDYTPSLNFYSSSAFQDTVDHRVSLHGVTSYENWTLSLSQLCALTSDPLIETARQTSQQTYDTQFGARYVVNSSTFLDLQAQQNFRFVDQTYKGAQGSSLNWSTADWLNRNWGSKIAVGIGPGLGYTLVGQGSDLLYEELQGRVLGQITPKLSLSLSGGGQVMEFVDSTASPLLSPIFAAALNYQPFSHTTLSLNASGMTTSSYYANEVADTKSLGASLRQRLLGMLFLTVSGGYANTAYTASAPGAPINADLNYEYVRVALSKTVFKRGDVSVFWSNSSNTSTQQGYAYSSNQVGFTLAYKY
jgi:hypothetical protein